jgi:CRISPR-associated endonuclease Csn1
LAEEFDVLSRLADVRVPQRLAEPRRLTQDERDACLAIIRKKGTLEWDAVRGITGDALPGMSFAMQKSLPKGISGMRATRALMKVLGPEYASWPVEVQASVVKTLAVAQSARQVREELETVMPIALTDSQWHALSGLMLPSGFGGLSLEALRRVVPLMRERADLDYAHATEAAGIGSHSLLHPADDDLLDELPYYGSVLRRYTQPLAGFVSATLSGMAAEEARYGRIGNPTVHVGLNELRKLVNAILRRYGRPSAIVVETTREFGLSGVKLTEHLRMQKKNEDYWEKARAEWQTLLGGNAGAAEVPGGAQDLSKGRLEKYLLWREMPASDRVCIYSGRPIGLADLIAGSDLEVDHILPESLTLDNSWDNKVLCFRSENQRKKQRDPYDAFGPHRGDPAAWEAIRQRLQLMVDKEKGMPFPGPWGTGVWKRRMAKFQEGATEQFLKERPLERRLLNATSYFSTVAREYLAHIVPNRAILASNGRMTAMLRREFGLKKDRSTHHHHAVDAALTACLVDRSWITKLQRLWKSREESGGRRPASHDRATLEYPYGDFRRELVTAAERVVISERPEHGVEGEIYSDTNYTQSDTALRQRLLSGEETARVTVMANTRAKPKVRRITLDVIRNPNRALPRLVEHGGNAYCDILAEAGGKWGHQVVRRVDAKRGGIAFPDAKKRHIMRLFKGDVLLLEEEGMHRLYKVSGVSASEQAGARITMNDLMLASPEDNQKMSKAPDRLRLAKARKVTVDMLGFVHDRGFVA